MSWFKTILLLGVLGMTWAECDRRPAAQTHAWPEAAFEPATTNAAVMDSLAGDAAARLLSVEARWDSGAAEDRLP